MKTGENAQDPRQGDEEKEPLEPKTHQPAPSSKISTFTRRPVDEDDGGDDPKKVGP